MPPMITMAVVGIILLFCSFDLRRVDARIDDSSWQQYKTDFGKSYESDEEEAARYVTWREELSEINAHNERYLRNFETYQQGVNAFTDMTWGEIETTTLYSPPALESSTSDVGSMMIDELKASSSPGVGVNHPPDSLDWRDSGWVTPVLEQGRCGSGWAIAAVGALEAQLMNSSGTLICLSVQEILDCDLISNGCRGGFPPLALEYAELNGIAALSDYPYTGERSQCSANDHDVAFQNSGGIISMTFPEDNYLQEIVAWYGPTVVGVSVDRNFLRYRSGVYEAMYCDSFRVNHALLIIGYGYLVTGEKYWLVKNSWGTNWGENGFGKMARESGRICDHPIYMTIPLV